MLSLSSPTEETSATSGKAIDMVEQYQIEAEYYRGKAAALLQKYEPPANEEVAVHRVVLDVLKIREEAEAAHLRRLQKARELDRQAIGVSELYLAHIHREISKLERKIDLAEPMSA